MRRKFHKIIEILFVEKKNNAALLGEAGTGKTAIVEGLSSENFQRRCTQQELKESAYSLFRQQDLTGTIYRGQLEERVQELCNEVKENDDVIVYIDEFHQAVSEGSSNIAQMLNLVLHVEK